MQQEKQKRHMAMWGKDDMRPNGRYCLHFCHYGIITLLPLHATSNKSNEMPIHKLHESVTLYVAKGPSCEAATQYNDPHMLPKDVKKRHAITCCLKMSISNKKSNTRKVTSTKPVYSCTPPPATSWQSQSTASSQRRHVLRQCSSGEPELARKATRLGNAHA